MYVKTGKSGVNATEASMQVEYAPNGLYGVLTPQANTTVEPELAVMTPLGYAWINGRLVSAKGTIESRLVDYYDSLTGALGQFANAPVRAIAIACTGASYLCGAAQEDVLVERWSAAAGVPVVTAAKAVTAALKLLGARRIGLASPYPASLNVASKPTGRTGASRSPRRRTPSGKRQPSIRSTVWAARRLRRGRPG